MKLLIVHLSDIHIKTENDAVLSRYKEIANVINSFQCKDSHLVFVVSGDITYSGKEVEYKLADGFFGELKTEVSGRFNADPLFIFSPGNHDCDFSKSSKAREMIISGLNEEGDIDASIIESCCVIQEEYFRFEARNTDLKPLRGDELYKLYELNVSGKKVYFDSLNFAWCSMLKEKQGDLIYPASYLDEFDSSGDLRIITFHHPTNWLKQGHYQHLRSKIRLVGNIVLTGHEHHGTGTRITDTRDGESFQMEGACLQNSSDPNDSGFTVLDVCLDKSSSQYYSYSWEENEYKCDTSGIDVAIELANSKNGRLGITPSFIDFLEDPGANFTHPGKDKLKLSEFYVSPDLEDISDEASVELISSDFLLKELKFGDELFIKGEDSSGKTALLKSYYMRMYDQGWFPLYVDCSSLSRATKSEVNKIVNKAILEQYSSDDISKYKSIDPRYKVLLVDDFDRMKSSDRYYHRVIELFKNAFNTIIITSGETLDISELVLSDFSEASVNFKDYKLQKFGNKLRYELIRKWSEIGESYSLSSQELLARVDAAEKVVRGVLGRNLVPKLPIYILTLLQNLESANASDIQNAGLGHYYQYLITEALGKSGVHAGEIGEYFTYFSQLAWLYYSRDEKELDKREIEAFTRTYSDEYTKVDFDNRFKKMNLARIIVSKGESYAFAYPFVYYFFLGLYLSENIEDQEVKSILIDACDHLYTKENANLIIFTLHNSKSLFLIDKLLVDLKSLFSERAALSLENDSEFIESFCGEAAELVYVGTNPQQNRYEANCLRDKIEEADENIEAELNEELHEKKQLNELDLASTLNKQFKSIEVLGQVLKSYYGPIKKERKIEIVDEIFSVVLRSLTDFFAFIEEDSESFVNELESFISEKDSNLLPDEIAKLARKFAFEILRMLTVSFMVRGASSVSSDKLRDVVEGVGVKKEDLAFKVMSIAMDLELPGPIPFSKINEVVKYSSNGGFACKLLQALILKHLYFFSVNERDKKKVCQLLDIPIHQANLNDFNSQGKKLT